MEWRCLFVILSALIAAQSGCRSLPSNLSESPVDNMTAKLTSDGSQSSSDIGEPDKMVAIWRENILQTDGAAPVKGFTGRFYFYDRAGEAIKVDGELNVYGFDDSKQVKQRIPDNHFIFKADRFAEHYSPSDIGHSYNIWIPWEEYGGYRKSITLIPVFKSANNKVVQGSADYLSLSGKARQKDTLERTIAGPVEPQQYNAGNSADAAAAYYHRQRANTIPVPQSISDQWKHQDLRRLANSRPMAPINQETMKALNAAEQQPDGSGYNVVDVQRDTLSSMPAYRPTQQQQVHQMMLQSNWNANNSAGITQQVPAAGNNAFEGTTGVHAALSDIAPPVHESRRVFGKPGTIR